jgi:hypothetical protein
MIPGKLFISSIRRTLGMLGIDVADNKMLYDTVPKGEDKYRSFNGCVHEKVDESSWTVSAIAHVLFLHCRFPFGKILKKIIPKGSRPPTNLKHCF